MQGHGQPDSPQAAVTFCVFLPAAPALNFYQRLRAPQGESDEAASPLWSGPYVPQCDVLGGWEPMQCHAGTGKETLSEYLEERASQGEASGSDYWLLFIN